MNKILTIIFISLIPLMGIYFFKLSDSYRYDSDFGRDIVDMLQITKGELTLIGPKLSFGGIHAGPYYYYLFAPVLLLSRYMPEALLTFNALVFMISFIFGAYWLYKTEKFNLTFSILSIYWLGLTPYFIFSGRGPGNAFSYIPLMFLLLIIFPWLLRQKKLIPWLIYGFFVGVVINTHLITIIVFASIFLVALRLNRIKAFIATGLGVLLSYAPILLFEVRHDFVIFKNTFIDKSYLAFTQNTNLPNPLSSSSNPLTNFNLLIGHFSTWSAIGFLAILIIILILAVKNKSKSPLVWGSLLSFLILSFAASSQLAIHYFFPFILVSQVALLYSLRHSKLQSLVLTLLITINLIHFPSYLYTNSPRKIDNYRQFASALASSDLMNQINKDSFNVFVARETPLAVLGWEYRYFLSLKGFDALPVESYNQAQNLLMISEGYNGDINSLQSWELSEFGAKISIAEKSISNRKVLIYSKLSL